MILSTNFSDSTPCLPWVMSDDKSKWRAELPDGRTAGIERLDDGASFLPKVHESAQDFEVGPVFDGVLAAAQWCTELAARTVPCGLCQLRAERGIKPPPGGCTCQAAL